MGLGDYLGLPFFQHALIAATLVAITCGLIGPFVITRGAAFAVHGVAEMSFTSAVAGLVWLHDPVLGALLGSIVMAGAIGLLGARQRERDSAIGVTLAFGLGVGIFLLGHYHGSIGSAYSILFGQILGISDDQLWLLLGVAGGVLITMLLIYRRLFFASIDPEVAEARGVRVRAIGLVFLLILSLTVTEAAQIVGTLLVLSLAITPAAAALRLSARPVAVAVFSIVFALIAADGGLLLNTQAENVSPSVFVTSISFGIYLIARVGGHWLRGRRSRPPAALGPTGP
ncbi:MAG TPA: metal ABC transporter permease [Jatrophihabitans sp.]